jgi:HAD superfamily hydrolase (TIGR01458 family)
MIRGLLLDVDGTLLLHDRALPGAAAALAALGQMGLPFLLLTNTTRRSRRATAERLQAAGLDVGFEKIVTPARLARRRILDSGRPRAGLLIADEARTDLEGVIADEERPEWVVMGDLGTGFTFERMNAGFRWVRAGAALLALHKNPWWDAGQDVGAVLDVGAYVAALEYATGRSAEVLGKPSPPFFRLALAELGLPPEAVLVVGDDLEMDVAGGAAAGCRTAWVRTGPRNTETTRVRPDLILESIAELPDRLARGIPIQPPRSGDGRR